MRRVFSPSWEVCFSCHAPSTVVTFPESTKNKKQLEPFGNYELFTTSDYLSVTKPMTILLYPDRTTTLFEGEEVQTTHRTCTHNTAVTDAQQAAQKLRDQGWKVTVYNCMDNGNPRIRVEYRMPEGDGYGKKRTKTCRNETDVCKYLTTLEKTENSRLPKRSVI